MDGIRYSFGWNAANHSSSFEYFYSGYHVISFYLIGVLGAGDIKLFSVIGGFTNLKTLTDCVLAAFVAGAVIAVLKMLYMRNLRISLFKAQVFLRELFSGKFSSYRNGWVQEQNLMHFSVAVLLGMLYAHRTVWLSLF
ncbi:MAG: prepilin peptidase [Roseburia faecis]